MKKFYHSDKGEFTCIDNNPLVSYETLESGTIVMWNDNTINSLIENMQNLDW